MDEIGSWRAKIDVLDEILVHLLNRRAEYALEIGKIKKRRGMPVYSSERETFILKEVQAVNKGPLKNEAVKRLFERIIDESRRLEREMIEEMERLHEGGKLRKGGALCDRE